MDAIFTDSEGVELPGSRWGGKFKGSMFESDDQAGPLVVISMPEHFSTVYGDYRGYGTLTCPLRPLLDDYLQMAHLEEPEAVAAFSVMLKEFAAELDEIASESAA